jgi:hypothetical protein
MTKPVHRAVLLRLFTSHRIAERKALPWHCQIVAHVGRLDSRPSNIHLPFTLCFSAMSQSAHAMTTRTFKPLGGPKEGAAGGVDNVGTGEQLRGIVFDVDGTLCKCFNSLFRCRISL